MWMTLTSRGDDDGSLFRISTTTKWEEQQTAEAKNDRKFAKREKKMKISFHVTPHFPTSKSNLVDRTTFYTHGESWWSYMNVKPWWWNEIVEVDIVDKRAIQVSLTVMETFMVCFTEEPEKFCNENHHSEYFRLSCCELWTLYCMHGLFSSSMLLVCVCLVYSVSACIQFIPCSFACHFSFIFIFHSTLFDYHYLSIQLEWSTLAAVTTEIWFILE